MNTSLSTGCRESSSIGELPGEAPRSEVFHGTMTNALGASWLPKMDMPRAFPPGTEVNLAPSSVVACASSVSPCASSFFGCGLSACACASSVFVCDSLVFSSGARIFVCACSACPCGDSVFLCAAVRPLDFWLLGLSSASATAVASSRNNNMYRLMASPVGVRGCEGPQSIWKHWDRPERVGCTLRNAPARTDNLQDTGRTEWQGFCAHSENRQTAPEPPHN